MPKVTPSTRDLQTDVINQTIQSGHALSQRQTVVYQDWTRPGPLPVLLWACWPNASSSITTVQTADTTTLELSTPQLFGGTAETNGYPYGIEVSPDGTLVAISQTVGASGRYAYGGVLVYTADGSTLTYLGTPGLAEGAPFCYSKQTSQATWETLAGWSGTYDVVWAGRAGSYSGSDAGGELVFDGGHPDGTQILLYYAAETTYEAGLGAACINGGEYAYISGATSGNIYKVNLTTAIAGPDVVGDSITATDAQYLALASGGAVLWYCDIVSGYVRSISGLPSSPTTGTDWAVSGLTGGITLDPDGVHAWVITGTTVQRLNLSTGALDSTITFAATPTDLGLPQP